MALLLADRIKISTKGGTDYSSYDNTKAAGNKGKQRKVAKHQCGGNGYQNNV
jgi:hypothetical protein